MGGYTGTDGTITSFPGPIAGCTPLSHGTCSTSLGSMELSQGPPWFGPASNLVRASVPGPAHDATRMPNPAATHESLWTVRARFMVRGFESELLQCGWPTAPGCAVPE